MYALAFHPFILCCIGSRNSACCSVSVLWLVVAFTYILQITLMRHDAELIEPKLRVASIVRDGFEVQVVDLDARADALAGGRL